MNEYRGLTGLRGIAALMVFWSHVKERLAMIDGAFEPHWLFERLFFSGGRQVDVFFVLSGFVMTLVYHNWFVQGVTRGGYQTFIRRRLARIYPLHVFVLLLVLGAVVVAPYVGVQMRMGADRFTYDTLPQHFLLIHAWGLGMSEPGAWNPPSWSISIEMLAYLVFPFLLWALLRLARRNPWLGVALTAAAGVAANLVWQWDIWGMGAIARGLTEFSLGCATALLMHGAAARWLAGERGALVALAIMAAGYAVVADTNIIIALACAPLLLSLCGDNAASRVLGSRPLHFLGEISYSLYLGHFFFVSLAYRLVDPVWMAGGAWQALAGGAVLTAIIIGLSTLTYYWVEVPARRWLGGARPAAHL